MKVDNHLPPALAGWMKVNLSVECICVRDLNLQRATDIEIFLAARAADVVVFTKDADFLDLLEQHGPPPQVVWVRCELRPLGFARAGDSAALPSRRSPHPDRER